MWTKNKGTENKDEIIPAGSLERARKRNARSWGKKDKFREMFRHTNNCNWSQKRHQSHRISETQLHWDRLVWTQQPPCELFPYPEMLWSFIKSERKSEKIDFRGKPPINLEPLFCNFLSLKLISWLFFLMPVAHSSTLHPPRPSHHQEHSHRDTPGLHFRGGRIWSTRK